MGRTKSPPDALFEIDLLIRQGEVGKAVSRLQRLRPAQLPLELFPKFGSLCRRTGLYHKGLLALTPEYRKSRNHEGAFALQAEYANLLQRRGATREALAILEKISPTLLPEVLVYRAYCHFSRWDYEAALPLLEEYPAKASNDYLKLVGIINLGAALVATGARDRAQETLRRAVELCRSGNHLRLLANCLEFLAQIEIDEGRYDSALSSLDEASLGLADDRLQDVVAIQKWRAIARSQKTGSTAPLDEFLKDGRQAVEFETLRLLDLYRLKVSFDDRLFRRLYIGTPYPSFRQKILMELGDRKAPEFAELGAAESSQRFELENVSLLRAVKIKPGTEMQKLLYLLLTDFYQPFRPGRIFSELFPEEEFDVAQSPAKIRTLLSRLGRQLKASGLGLGVKQTPQGYLLQVGGEVCLRVPVALEILDHQDLICNEIHDARGVTQFSFLELVAILDVGEDEARGTLQQLLQAGRLEKNGSARATTYSLKNNINRRKQEC